MQIACVKVKKKVNKKKELYFNKMVSCVEFLAAGSVFVVWL